MIKILRVGDPHAKAGNLEEMKSLILFVAEQAKLNKVHRIELLGDLFHTHNIIRLEVLEFWNWALDLLRNITETVVIVGNHDISGDFHSTFSALSVFALMNRDNLVIIEKPTVLGPFCYVPYIHNATDFITAADHGADSGATILVCHQTFAGSKFESGVYAPDGIPAGDWSERYEQIISGHIHSEQNFGNFIYPGTARWDSITDANRRKGIWLFEHEKDGSLIGSSFISTEEVCSPIQCLEWKEGDAEPNNWSKNARVALELIGSSNWVAQMKEKYKGKCSIKTKITDKKTTTVRKTGNNFEDFVKTLFVSNMDRTNLINYAKELGII